MHSVYNEVMEMQNYDENCWKKPCPKVDCRAKKHCCGLQYVNIPASLGDDSKTSSVAPKVGNYCNAIVNYEINGHLYIYSTEGIPSITEPGNKAIWEAIDNNTVDIGVLQDGLANEMADRAAGDKGLQDQIDELKNNPDVVDIVATYADLQAYDTQHLTNNDIIRVLNDETHNGYSTYYKFTKNPDTWTYIGTSSHDYTFESFTFTLMDNTTVTKDIAVQSQGA